MLNLTTPGSDYSGLYDFDRLRYPPPLEQRRSSETDIRFPGKLLLVASFTSRLVRLHLLQNVRANVYGRVCPHRSTRDYDLLLSRNCESRLLCWCVTLSRCPNILGMLLVLRMRNFAQIKLR
jgi:hypothetical protein